MRPSLSVPIEVPAYYDFASTICYVTHRVMQRRAPELAEIGVVLRWRPLDLTRITGWHLPGLQDDRTTRLVLERRVRRRAS